MRTAAIPAIRHVAIMMGRNNHVLFFRVDDILHLFLEYYVSSCFIQWENKLSNWFSEEETMRGSGEFLDFCEVDHKNPSLTKSV